MKPQNFPFSAAPSLPGDFGVSPLEPLSALEMALKGSEAECQSAITAASSRLASIEERALAAMSRGASPPDFKVLRALVLASEAARQTLDHAATLRSSFYSTKGK